MTEVSNPPSSCGESDASMRQRLFTSLSQSFPGSALSKALHFMTDSDDEGDMKTDRLSSSCFAELRMERNNDNNNDESDDDLTSLSWLQEMDLLKNLNTNSEGEDQKENGNPFRETSNQTSHPTHIPYNPFKHINSKPPYSFSCLIFMAVEESPNKRLPVKDIYNWILTRFPYFQNAPTGWKNSVRHNLSLNKCFKKVDKDRGQAIGKGSLWCIDPDYRPHLLQALRKTPYHPYHQLQMLAAPQISLQGFLPNKPYPLSNHVNNFSQISPHLFPFLSKRLSESKSGLDNTDIEIANTLVALKSRSQSANGSPNNDFAQRMRKRWHANVICTSFPSVDHTYSTMRSPGRHDNRADSPSSSIDDEYDFGSDDDIDDDNFDDVTDYSSCHSDYDEIDGDIGSSNNRRESRKRKSSKGSLSRRERSRKRQCLEEDENMKIAEGANALLNLAGFTTTQIVSLRSISPDSGNHTTPSASNTDLYRGSRRGGGGRKTRGAKYAEIDESVSDIEANETGNDDCENSASDDVSNVGVGSVAASGLGGSRGDDADKDMDQDMDEDNGVVTSADANEGADADEGADVDEGADANKGAGVAVSADCANKVNLSELAEIIDVNCNVDKANPECLQPVDLSMAKGEK